LPNDKFSPFGANLIFTHIQKSAGGASQTVTVSREVKLVEAKLVVDVVEKKDFRGRPVNRAVAEIEVVAEIPGQDTSELRTLRYSRDLGEWTDRSDRSNWDRCVLEP